ncbi:hypothetical protein HYH03_015069 [Edaphochlamys debaryana]|uniref:Uncharacterized protein n=1 Tax=Edaphochlamys debaryana TaxID=47281 RepID=A0A835XUR8_9CHLO|nr:hypothetical protein HYH03_015069 [Edaphochlamys debaryana]|eukprot:KAG2486244.1 hypothetical protein HYH03_015069 [Edaphochlamys debaryana]
MSGYWSLAPRFGLNTIVLAILAISQIAAAVVERAVGPVPALGPAVAASCQPESFPNLRTALSIDLYTANPPGDELHGGLFNLTACGHGPRVVLLIKSTPPPSTRRLGLPVFRIRVVGPSGVWRERVLECSDTLAVAGLEMTQRGLHSAEVLLQYPDLSLCDIANSTHATVPTDGPTPGSPSLKPWLGYLHARWHDPPTSSAPHRAAVRARTRRHLQSAPSGARHAPHSADGHHTPSMHLAWSAGPPSVRDFQAAPHAGLPLSGPPGSNASDPQSKSGAAANDGRPSAAAGVRAAERCAPLGLQPGRWVWSKGWDAGAQAEAASIARSCVWMPNARSVPPSVCNNTVLQFDWSASALRWRGRNCSAPDFADFDMPACLARLGVGPAHGGRKLCTLGDSHSRYLSYALDGWTSNFTKPSIHDCRTWDKSNPVSDYVAFLSDPWAERDNGANAENCSVVIANHGNWPLSFQTKGRPQNASRYAATLQKWLKPLAAVQALGRTRVVYALTLAEPEQWRRLLGQDWRTEPVMEQYNLAAIKVATELGLPILDLWGPSVGLTESSWDSSHYFWKGAVGHVVLSRAVASLCS